MRLYLVQHGEACAKEVDPERPLSRNGIEDIDRLAGFLKQTGIRIDKAIHSGKLRAMQTAERIAKVVSPGIELLTSNDINPKDDPKEFIQQIAEWTKDTLVVGHLPFMASLVSLLAVDDESELTTAFQPGSIICLERTENALWQINWMVTPDCLVAINKSG